MYALASQLKGYGLSSLDSGIYIAGG